MTVVATTTAMPMSNAADALPLDRPVVAHISLTTDKPALYVMLTTLAAGRFSMVHGLCTMDSAPDPRLCHVNHFSSWSFVSYRFFALSCPICLIHD
jgi:hypothetical protein